MKVLVSLFALAVSVAAADLNYKNDFEKAGLGTVPDDLLILDGAFSVKEEGGNKFIELPGAPLDTFGFLFGPTAKEEVTASARVLGTAKGRRFPTFEVGLNGVGGYRLRVSPAKKQLELLRSDAVKEAAALEWTPGKWTSLKLSVERQGAQWRVTGKIWQDGAEPKEPAIVFLDSEAPPSGRASVFGMPYSGTPIRFDDLAVSSSK